MARNHAHRHCRPDPLTIPRSPADADRPSHKPPRCAARGAKTSGRQSFERGVTLLEVMVALGIAATVLVSVYRLQAQSIAMETIARFHTLAPLLAQQLAAENGLRASEFSSADSGDFGNDFPGYTWTLETTDIGALADPNGRPLLKRIDVKIHFNDDQDLFTLRTYRLAKSGS